jgi:hypothetical protein
MRRWRLLRVIYLVVFIALLALAWPYVMRYINMLNDLSGQK